jgi:hypothetical protein
MSQNVTLSTTISPAQALALQVLVGGGSITKAATEAGVARETVSRWVHHDPVFLAELHNVRAELAIQTRCALEALGTQAVGVLVDAVQNQFVKPWRVKNAVIIRALFGNLVARILTASRDGLRDESHQVERVARTGRKHGMRLRETDWITG